LERCRSEKNLTIILMTDSVAVQITSADPPYESETLGWFSRFRLPSFGCGRRRFRAKLPAHRRIDEDEDRSPTIEHEPLSVPPAVVSAYSVALSDTLNESKEPEALAESLLPSIDGGSGEISPTVSPKEAVVASSSESQLSGSAPNPDVSVIETAPAAETDVSPRKAQRGAVAAGRLRTEANKERANLRAEADRARKAAKEGIDPAGASSKDSNVSAQTGADQAKFDSATADFMGVEKGKPSRKKSTDRADAAVVQAPAKEAAAP
jgi:hypothetical protein